MCLAWKYLLVDSKRKGDWQGHMAPGHLLWVGNHFCLGKLLVKSGACVLVVRAAVMWQHKSGIAPWDAEQESSWRTFEIQAGQIQLPAEAGLGVGWAGFSWTRKWAEVGGGGAGLAGTTLGVPFLSLGLSVPVRSLQGGLHTLCP